MVRTPPAKAGQTKKKGGYGTRVHISRSRLRRIHVPVRDVFSRQFQPFSSVLPDFCSPTEQRRLDVPLRNTRQDVGSRRRFPFDFSKPPLNRLQSTKREYNKRKFPRLSVWDATCVDNINDFLPSNFNKPNSEHGMVSIQENILSLVASFRHPLTFSFSFTVLLLLTVFSHFMSFLLCVSLFLSSLCFVFVLGRELLEYYLIIINEKNERIVYRMAQAIN